KALISDTYRTLKRTLRELETNTESSPRAAARGLTNRLRIGRRTGDTPERIRRLQRRHPPDILLTTPESLSLLLSQPSSADMFAELRWIVIDEAHALAANKGGADLALSLERLQPLAGPPLRRIGLSAPCPPLPVAAAFLAGAGRSCAIAAVPETA